MEISKMSVEKDRWLDTLEKRVAIHKSRLNRRNRSLIYRVGQNKYLKSVTSASVDTSTTGNALHSVACCSGIHCGETEQWTVRIAFRTKNEVDHSYVSYQRMDIIVPPLFPAEITNWKRTSLERSMYSNFQWINYGWILNENLMRVAWKRTK